MLNLNIIAKPYAKAAFEFADQNGLIEEWSKLLYTFAELFGTSPVSSIISSPKVSQSEVVELLKDHLDEKFFNFILLIAQNKKLEILPLIFKHFEVIKNIKNNSKVANVILAYKADEKLLDNLKASLEKRFDCSINLKINIDPAIMGGAIVKVGDTVIDDSVSGRLEKLKGILLS